MRLSINVLFLLGALVSFAQKKDTYKGKYGEEHLEQMPSPPNYEELDYWIAHPEVQDAADMVPGKGELAEYQESADVDVFFIYPTIYTKKQYKDHPWYADVNDQKLNKQIANSTIKYQSTVFNASGKIYAPLYRQAHIGVYYSDLKIKTEALEAAYLDVKNAFRYYLENWNNGRPIIIASHSQGTSHAVKLLRDFFEYDEKLKSQLVAAYIIGMPLDKNTFNEIPFCKGVDDVGCWLTWNTFIQGYYPPNHEYWYGNALNVNPLSWKTDTSYVSWGMNKGGILKNFKKIRPGLSDAQNMDGMLWINKPKFFGNFLLNWKRYHVVDYNLFYLNIRENVEERVANFLNQD